MGTGGMGSVSRYRAGSLRERLGRPASMDIDELASASVDEIVVIGGPGSGSTTIGTSCVGCTNSGCKTCDQKQIPLPQGGGYTHQRHC